MPCLVVESSRGKKRERCVREKDLKRFTVKESLKGSRKESLLERARRRSKPLTPYLRQRGINSSSQTTPVLAAGFHWKETFATSIKLQSITQLGISHEPREIKRAKYAKALLAGTSVVLVNAV